VGRFRNSKAFLSDTPEIVSVRALVEHALLKEGKPTEAVAATASHGVFSFLLGEARGYTCCGACALVENPAVFTQFERLELPVGLAIYGQGRASARLVRWLAANTTRISPCCICPIMIRLAWLSSNACAANSESAFVCTCLAT